MFLGKSQKFTNMNFRIQFSSFQASATVRSLNHPGTRLQPGTALGIEKACQLCQRQENKYSVTGSWFNARNKSRLWLKYFCWVILLLFQRKWFWIVCYQHAERNLDYFRLPTFVLFTWRSAPALVHTANISPIEQLNFAVVSTQSTTLSI
jgi:hypothetical protein